MRCTGRRPSCHGQWYSCTPTASQRRNLEPTVSNFMDSGSNTPETSAKDQAGYSLENKYTYCSYVVVLICFGLLQLNKWISRQQEQFCLILQSVGSWIFMDSAHSERLEKYTHSVMRASIFQIHVKYIATLLPIVNQCLPVVWS